MNKYKVCQYLPGSPSHDPAISQVQANKYILDNVYGLVTFIKNDEPVFVLHTTAPFTIEKLEESQ